MFSVINNRSLSHEKNSHLRKTVKKKVGISETNLNIFVFSFVGIQFWYSVVKSKGLSKPVTSVMSHGEKATGKIRKLFLNAFHLSTTTNTLSGPAINTSITGS